MRPGIAAELFKNSKFVKIFYNVSIEKCFFFHVDTRCM